MLGSSHDGERAAAALKAADFLRARNLTWEEFIRQIIAGRKPERAPHWSEGPKTDAEWMRAFRTECWDYLNPWEQSFVTDVLKRSRWPLSPKQREVLLKLKEKYGRVYT